MMRYLNLILLSVALFSLALLMKELDWADLSRYIFRGGYYWPLVLVPYGLVNFLGALSWSCLFPIKASRPSLGQLYFLRLAGDSLNQLTPTASIGGEFFRVQRLQAKGIPLEEATVSVIIQKAILALSLAMYALLGLSLTAFTLNTRNFSLGRLGAAALVLGIAALAFLFVQRKNPCVSGIRFLERFNLCPRNLKEKEAKLAALDSCLAGFYQEHPCLCFLSFILLFMSWLCHGTEVYLIFRLLGHPVSWGMALSFDALVMLFAALGFMIPASLGAQDGGAVLVSVGFGLGAALGAAFCIIRRLREAFWLSIGLLFFGLCNRLFLIKTKTDAGKQAV